jgi:anti-sigma28 factor (negative regulator of flagellin synthesis)
MINSIKSGMGYINLLKKDEQKEVSKQQETDGKSVSNSRVDDIKKAIEDGTYKVDIPLLAKKMADEINLERG